MKPFKSLRPRLLKSHGFVASASVALIFAPTSQAQSFRYWDGGDADLAGDGNSVSAGGDGTWDTTIKNWDAGTVPYEAWDNSAGNFAAFGGSGPYTVTLGAGVTVGGFAFNAVSGGTSIVPGTGPYAVDLAGTTVNVSFNNAKLGTISADLATGTSDLVVGSTAGSTGGVLTLTGEVIGSGNISVLNGTTLKLSGSSSLTSGNLLLNGGGILGLDNGNFSRGIGTGAGQVPVRCGGAEAAEAGLPPSAGIVR